MRDRFRDESDPDHDIFIAVVFIAVVLIAVVFIAAVFIAVPKLSMC